MKIRYILVLVCLLIITPQYAQTFEEFKQQRESEFAAYKQKQQEFINQMQNEFDEYVKQQDQQFAEYLEEQWNSFKVVEGEVPPNIPKPPEKPTYAPPKQIKKRTGTTTQLKGALMIMENGKARPLFSPAISKSAEPKTKGAVVIISFYGSQLSFDVDEQVIIDPPSAVSELSIRDFWVSFSESNFSSLLYQFQNYRNIMNLNDWAYYQLLDKFASSVYANSEIGADLMLWSLLTRSGYKARIGYAGNSTSLLLPSNNTLYSREFLKSDGLTYYLMKDLHTDDIRTYNKDYPDAVGTMDFNIYRPLNFAVDMGQKNLEFNYMGKQYSFYIDYNKNVIDFYRDYPQVDIQVYFNAAVSHESKESMIRELSGIIADMPPNQAVSLLLRFVQTAFKYEVDNNQFGKEKFFFAEETIYYPASDCEDRSVLFAYLIKELLDFKVIGLEYPRHISTAVKLQQDVVGDYVIFNNEHYLVADATYENAPLGLTMPDYRNEEPEVIVLNNNNYFENLSHTYWNLVAESGGHRGDKLVDMVFDSDSNAYLTGYFIKSANFERYSLETGQDESSRGSFVVKYSKDKKVLWAKQITGSQNVTGYALVMDGKGDLYATGSFNGEVDVSENYPMLICKENVSDVYLAKLSSNGQLFWIKKAGLDTYPQENYFTYNVKFSEDGSGRGTILYSEDEFNPDFGLSIDPGGILSITGSFMNSTGFGLNMLSFVTDEGEEFSVFESLKLENDKLIDEKYEKTIAGLFSVLNHIRLSGFKMLGTDAQKTLDEYNPKFKEDYPDIYDGISKINFVLNNDGMVTVETLNRKTVILRELRIKNNAKMKVTPYRDGNAQLNILSGVQVGKFFIWFDLNFAKLYKHDGNILFDFDSDHTQKVMNLKEDILE